ncbi:peptide/nickel transport system substrate-binding protein [Salegentibacter echinorum]|uniref:Peptide/nickel transport system substrate-binding protein n=1 Tax=Salegentibacter echinorum TaxID=1073325 RepID=A0A1M5K4G6_SALEC|nr:ABC transporter substrate-binding protein [Salegentibacter echinorum]SHG47611.1 peptide/nickel transport system substrate-binding protein [Salegentibacter echinorum]
MKIHFKNILIAFTIGLLSTSCAQDKKTHKSKSDELVLAIGGEPDNGFDPTTGWGQYGSPLFQSTLLKYDKDLKIDKDLATNYSLSDNGLEWEIEIRDSIKFSDGKPLTANDVIFTFRTAKESNSVVDLTNLKKIEKINNHKIKFYLKKRNSTFVYYLATLGIVPRHAYNSDYNENPIGSGPYQMVEWNKGQQLIVKRNPYYYGDKSYFKKLSFLFLSEDAAIAAAKSGDVDVVSVSSTFANNKVDGMKLVNIESVDNRGVVLPYVKNEGENIEGAPIGNDVTSDIAIRKAMNIAVDRKKLVEGVLNGYGTPAYTIADHLPWWNPDTHFKDGRLNEAKSILNEAGWIENKNGIREKNGLKAKFDLYYPSNDQTRQSLSIAFADMMQALGIEIKTKGKSWNVLDQALHANAIMFGLGSYTPLELYNAFSTNTQGQGLKNINYYANPTVDAYFKKALEASSQEEAMEYWKKAQWDGKTGFTYKGDAPIVWLVNIDHLYFVANKLNIGKQKIHPHGHGWPITDQIETWHWED